MAQYFITRPVFAWVLAIVVMLFGAFSMARLPIEQYPDIAPTRVDVVATYPGASAEVTENSVTSVVEDAMTGLDGLLFMNATSSATGRATISLTFDDSVDRDMAQIQVQNRVARVEAALPEVVRQRGVVVRRTGDSSLLVGALVSRDGRYTSVELGDLAAQLVEDSVQRVEGVGGIDVFTPGYAMRVWLDPVRMAEFQITAQEVTSAIAEQNSTVSVGSLGGQPVVPGQQLTVPLSAQTQMTGVDQFAQILLRVEADGSEVVLSDVAKVEIGQESYGSTSFMNGQNSAGFSVTLATGANAVETARRVRDLLSSIEPALPDGVEVAYPYDTSPFIEQSIGTVYKTLIEAVILVFMVILIFLQSWRATIIPVIAIPVVLLGTFGVLLTLGYSINTLTMFAMVLAIGLLVDDAIVVVENVERVMAEEHIGPVEATRKSMTEISSALVGIVMVLSAVFLPMAFMSGSTGVIYRQFSVTIITAMILSLGVALILTPAMCAVLLRPHKPGGGNMFSRLFNRNFDRLTRGYGKVTWGVMRVPFLVLMVLLGISGGAFRMFQELPSSFVPQEDQGVLMIILNLAEGSTSAQTQAISNEVQDWLLEDNSEAVDSVMTALGFAFGGNAGQNRALLYVKLKPFDARPGISAAMIQAEGQKRFAGHRAGNIIFMQPPAIQGLGSGSGISYYMIDQAGNGQSALEAAAQEIARQAEATGQITGFRGHEPSQRPALKLEIDQRKARAMGLTVSEVNNMLSVIFSGREVNDFQLGAELRPVVVQGAAEWRMQPGDIEMWHARNRSGEMVPFSSFINQVWTENSPSLNRFGGTRAISINASPTPGVSTGEAMETIERLVAELPGGYGVGWIGLSYQEKEAGNQAPMLFALSALVVFLCLAALYESWSVPFSVLLAAPVGILGALVAAWWFGQSNDVYFKVGLLTTIGLASRNAILIVEFAESLRAGGMALRDAAMKAATLRLRPILMTSFAFALGVLPLAIATGAGSAAQHAIGIGVLGGMIFTTVIAIFMVPALYVLVMRMTRRA
ncbi:multidrug efflux RND transporter permease subunit [Falsigemmobacter faecalis]|uniref:Efflux pump membrane transporter n=1 Tax=Falsigemmobacter faecalis TaxID=2488730 RepID=A0A3P3DV35_9RHOB|nr:multidrug efflux RND transporter permease subunit [Falsigemmobacter faecalis]RRH78100.1 multidrug efflux RND transporter permease subunit [Falsigemmobacter faecalis]